MSPMSNRDYLIISAVRNEEKYLGVTIESVVRQTLRPLQWVVIDDGSTDGTLQLIQTAARKEPWIQVVNRKDRGFRQSGVGVVEAFYDGFCRVESLPWEYVVKMDGDLRLPSDYFQRLIEEFERDPRLGICSGDVYNETAAGLVLDSPGDPAFHVRGAAKIYRRDCWTAIGGIQRVTGFDSVDNVKARMLGWDTRRFPRPQVIHLRKTGQATGSWRNGLKNGLGANAIGYHPLFLLLKCAKRFGSGSPIQAAGLLCGFLRGYFVDIPRIREPELLRYLRKQQLKRMLGQESIWR
jgi:poly-beta-1,6-N-acetyl-D-glucosamine synthase